MPSLCCTIAYFKGPLFRWGSCRLEGLVRYFPAVTCHKGGHHEDSQTFNVVIFQTSMLLRYRCLFLSCKLARPSLSSWKSLKLPTAWRATQGRHGLYGTQGNCVLAPQAPCVCTYWQCHKVEAHPIQPLLQSGVIFHFRILARGRRILTHPTRPWHLGIGLWSGAEQWGDPFQGSGDGKNAINTAVVYCQSRREQKPARETGKCQIYHWNNRLVAWT